MIETVDLSLNVGRIKSSAIERAVRYQVASMTIASAARSRTISLRASQSDKEKFVRTAGFGNAVRKLSRDANLLPNGHGAA